MKRTLIALLAVTGLWMPFGSGDTSAQISNSTYSAVPPFANQNATPNVLILLDNSGSMGRRANCDVSSSNPSDPGRFDFPNCTRFDETVTYGGLFDPMMCYTYDTADTRFESPTPKATISTPCAATQWDGNFLNWVTLRRIDMAKVALIGGSCAVARNADGTCPPIGSPPKITITAANKFAYASGGTVSTPAVPTGAGANHANGRVPTAVQTSGASPGNLWFHVMGTDMSSTLIGSFCVDDDNAPPRDDQSSCTRGRPAPPSYDGTANDSDAFNEQRFVIRVVKDTEPTGVIQEVGGQVRFGLMKFLGVSYIDGIANEGGQVEVPIGSRQWRAWNGTSVTTYSSNTVAMVNAIDASYNRGNTPMAEALYEAARYFAQVGSAFHTSVYVYPNSFATTGLGGTGPGSLGPGEESVLTGSESCPSAYGYTANACGRDPYFLGSNHVPAWASPSTQAPCCESFVIIFTDGDSQQDESIPAALQDLAHAYHGQHCTGADGTLGAPVDGTCNVHPATPTATLMREHKTDFANAGTHYLDDVAYWMHTRDLRPGFAGDVAPASSSPTIENIGVTGRPLQGFQNVTVYAFFAFAQMVNREFLLNTAKQGGFEDLNHNRIPDCDTVVLTNPCEWDRVVNATGAAGRDNIPDTYFESSDVAEMKDKLAQALSSILQRATSGTSLSVLATSTTGEGALYQAFFFPKVTEGLTNVHWLGFTQALFLDTFGNLREDTNGDGRLIYKDDLIVKTRYDSATGEVKADLFRDISPAPDGDGKADTPSAPTSTVALRDLKPIWEAGKKLALRNESTSPRKILTWVDLDADGIVDANEQIEFKSSSPDNRATLRPYLRAADLTEADRIIRWIRGEPITGYRNRELTVGGSTRTWKYGDTIHSTPTVVGAPRERLDIVYGDTSYADFFKMYRTRRQVAYVGANDGMLHAFNVGFYNPGDDPATPDKVEHGWFTTQRLTAPFVSNTPALGEELWAFIPQELLPQLKFLTQGDYQHVYYVDGKPKITDARIFCDGSAGAPTAPNCVTGQGTGSSHPNGWGTILIGSFRLGGSCQNCNVGATDLTVTADFNYDGDTTDPGDTRRFRSAYFALDITDPELDPKLLWVFTDGNLGLSLGYPSVGRVRPAGGDKTTNSDARWFMAVGSGPTGYDVGSVQTGRVYVVDLVKKATSNALNTAFYTFPTIQTCGAAAPNSECSLIGNVVAVDTDLDYRTDVLYFGNIICNTSTAPCNGSATPAWKGRFYRLTTGSSTNPALGTETDPCGWGVGSGPCARTPSVLLDDFACSGICTGPNHVGPVSAAPNVSQDDANKIWVYWGTGRYFSNADKINADVQHFFGVKDLVPTSGCTQTSATACEEKDLENVSNAEVCVLGTTTGSGTCSATNQVTGVTGVDSFDSSSGSSNTLLGRIQNKDGWYTTLDDQNPLTPTRERVLSQPTIIAGLVFFPSFEPENNICASSGSSFLYALFYKSGTANKEAVIGTVSQGGNTNVARRQALGDPGMASGVAMHLGAQGSGSGGGGGCQGRLTANIQSSTGSVSQTCITKTAGVPWSYYVSWMSQRES